AADQVRVGSQPEDGQGPRFDNPAIHPRPSRRDHPVAHARPNARQLLGAALGFAGLSIVVGRRSAPLFLGARRTRASPPAHTHASPEPLVEVRAYHRIQTTQPQFGAILTAFARFLAHRVRILRRAGWYEIGSGDANRL